MVHLGDPIREVEILPDPIPIDRNNIPKEVLLNAVVRFFINRINRKWEKDKIFFDQEDYINLNEAYWQNFKRLASEASPLGLSYTRISIRNRQRRHY